MAKLADLKFVIEKLAVAANRLSFTVLTQVEFRRMFSVYARLDNYRLSQSLLL